MFDASEDGTSLAASLADAAGCCAEERDSRLKKQLYLKGYSRGSLCQHCWVRRRGGRVQEDVEGPRLAERVAAIQERSDLQKPGCSHSLPRVHPLRQVGVWSQTCSAAACVSQVALLMLCAGGTASPRVWYIFGKQLRPRKGYGHVYLKPGLGQYDWRSR